MTRGHGNKEFWLAALRANGAAMRAAFEEGASSEAGLATPVPSCPDWTLLDLIHHVGLEYLKVRSHVSRGVTSRPETDPREAAGELPTGTPAIQWWADEFEQLFSILDTVDPQLPAWNWAPTTKQAAFWHRRMAHETAIHRWDAQMAIGAVEPIEAKQAVDGVAEVLDTWLPAGERKGATDRTGVVQLVATDAEEEWFVRLRGEGVALLDTGTLLDHDDPHTRVLARGTASDLLLSLWGRVPFDVLEITGDARLLDALRTG
ncbi:MAG TPA: maleylpyruvate isomerase N-terminal domain-containing protein [Natronosporangium sp.]